MQSRNVLHRSKQTGRLLAAALVAAAMLAGTAKADVAVSVGDLVLSANQANQVRQFYFTGSGSIDAFEFDIQIGDGGAELGGTSMGPRITAIDLKTGTFASGGAQANVVSFPLACQSTVDMSSPVSVSGGLLATVTFDTTGMLIASTQPLLLSGVAGSYSTRFLNGVTPVGSTITNGTISVVVPEPASLGILSLAAVAMLGRCWRVS